MEHLYHNVFPQSLSPEEALEWLQDPDGVVLCSKIVFPDITGLLPIWNHSSWDCMHTVLLQPKSQHGLGQGSNHVVSNNNWRVWGKKSQFFFSDMALVILLIFQWMTVDSCLSTALNGLSVFKNRTQDIKGEAGLW